MATRKQLARRLRQAREKREWSVGFAASRTINVGRGTLHNLELGKTDPSTVQVKTALQLVDLFYPDVQMLDFVSAEEMGDLAVHKLPPSKE